MRCSTRRAFDQDRRVEAFFAAVPKRKRDAIFRRYRVITDIDLRRAMRREFTYPAQAFNCVVTAGRVGAVTVAGDVTQNGHAVIASPRPPAGLPLFDEEDE